MTDQSSDNAGIFPGERDFFVISGATNDAAIVPIANPLPNDAPW